MVNSAKMTGRFLELKKGDTAFLCLSPETIAGKMMIVRALVLELRLIVGDISSAPLLNLSEHIDFAAMVPLQVSTSLERTPDALKAIRKIIIGGAPVSSTLADSFHAFPNEVYQTYGMTETISHIAMRDLKGNDPSFQLLPGISISTEDQCLVISAPHLGVNDLKTNDLVSINEHGNGFQWLGRKDFVINSGGIKIHPEVIEDRLSRMIRAPFFSIGIPDDKLGERHVLCIESDETDFTKSDFKEILSPYETPGAVYFFDKFVYTTSGKINRPETMKLSDNAKKRVL